MSDSVVRANTRQLVNETKELSDNIEKLLKATIENTEITTKQNEIIKNQNEKLGNYTVLIIILSIVMALGTIAQVFIALCKP